MAKKLPRSVDAEKTRDDDGRLGQHPIAAIPFVILFAAAAVAMNSLNIQSLLIKNWLITQMTAAALWTSLVWLIPKYALRCNEYLWTESRAGVSVRRSLAVVVVAYFLGFIAITVLLLVGQVKHAEMTVDWPALWSLVVAAAVLPAILGVVIGLNESGATTHFKWLKLTQALTVRSTAGVIDFNDSGRILITIVGAFSIALIQGGIVLTGGLSRSFFTVLLVSAGTVATLASKRPVYMCFMLILSLSAAGSTEWVGSYAPPGHAYYPTAHFAMFALALGITSLIDLGERLRPSRRRSTPVRAKAKAKVVTRP